MSMGKKMSYYIKYSKYHNQVVDIVITLIFFSLVYIESNSHLCNDINFILILLQYIYINIVT